MEIILAHTDCVIASFQGAWHTHNWDFIRCRGVQNDFSECDVAHISGIMSYSFSLLLSVTGRNPSRIASNPPPIIEPCVVFAPAVRLEFALTLMDVREVGQHPRQTRLSAGVISVYR